MSVTNMQDKAGKLGQRASVSRYIAGTGYLPYMRGPGASRVFVGTAAGILALIFFAALDAAWPGAGLPLLVSLAAILGILSGTLNTYLYAREWRKTAAWWQRTAERLGATLRDTRSDGTSGGALAHSAALAALSFRNVAEAMGAYDDFEPGTMAAWESLVDAIDAYEHGDTSTAAYLHAVNISLDRQAGSAQHGSADEPSPA